MVYTYEAPRKEDTSLGKKLVLERVKDRLRYEELSRNELVVKAVSYLTGKNFGVIHIPSICMGIEEDLERFRRLIKAVYNQDGLGRFEQRDYLRMISEKLIFDGSDLKTYNPTMLEERKPVIVVNGKESGWGTEYQSIMDHLLMGYFAGAFMGFIGSCMWFIRSCSPLRIQQDTSLIVGSMFATALVGSVIGYLFYKFKSDHSLSLSEKFQEHYSNLSLLETEQMVGDVLDEYKRARENLDAAFNGLVEGVEILQRRTGASVILKGENVFPRLEEMIKRYAVTS